MKPHLMWSRTAGTRDLLLGAVPAGILLGLLLYETSRQEGERLMLLWMLLFGLYAIWLWVGANTDPQQDRQRALTGIGLAVVLRLIALFATPQLSDDYFRFLWDGQLWLSGVNPFTILPEQLAAEPGRLEALGLSQAWFDQLNSPGYFTVYPPLLQGLFVLAATTGSLESGLLLLKMVVFLAECGTLWLLWTLLGSMGKPRHLLLWYALNPLVLVELCGNLHFEALMIVCLLGAFLALQSGKRDLSAVLLALSVLSKLLPLVFLPFLIRRIGWKASIRYGLIVAAVLALGFLPMLSEDMIAGLRESLTLYVNRFEFNAGVWYVVRWWGYQEIGYNTIRTWGPWLTRVAAGGILLYALLEWRGKRLPWAQPALFSLTLYFFLSLIVHPWYITTLVAMAPLVNRRFPLIWSVWLPWTYLAYMADPVAESMWLVGLEYGSVFIWLVAESFWRKQSAI